MNTYFFQVILNELHLSYIYVKTELNEIEVKEIIKSSIIYANENNKDDILDVIEDKINKVKEIVDCKIIYDDIQYITFDLP